MTGTVVTMKLPGTAGSAARDSDSASHMRARIGRTIDERLAMVCLPDSVGSGASVAVMPRSFSASVGSGA